MVEMQTGNEGRVALIAEAVAKGETYQSIGDRLGVTRERIRQIAKRHRLGGGRKAVWEKHAAFVAAYRETRDFEATCKAFEYTYGTALTTLRRAGIVGPLLSAKRARDAAILAPLAERVKNGESLNSVCNEDRALGQKLRRWCKDHGIKSQAHTRWTDLSHRIPIIRAARASGRPWKQISDELASIEGRRTVVPALVNWATRHVPGLQVQARAKREPTTVSASAPCAR